MKYGVITKNENTLRNFRINVYDKFAFTKIIYKSTFKNINITAFFSIFNGLTREIIKIPPSYYTFTQIKDFVISNLSSLEFKKLVLRNLHNIDGFVFMKIRANYEVHLCDTLKDCFGFEENLHKIDAVSQKQFKEIPSYFKIHCDQIDSKKEVHGGILLPIKSRGINFYNPSYLDWNDLFKKKFEYFTFSWPKFIEVILIEVIFYENLNNQF